MRFCGSLIAVLLATVMLAGCNKPSGPSAPAGKPRVVVSIFPFQSVVKEIAGDDVDVDCLLTPGQSPHGFEMKATQAESLTQARLLILVGLGVDEWAQRASQAINNPGLKVLTLSEDSGFRNELKQLFAQRPPASHPAASEANEPQDEHEDEHSHAHEGVNTLLTPNPHVWLDAVFMQQFARAITDSLIELDPAHKEEFIQRRDALIQKLRDLDDEYRVALKPFEGRAFVTYHAAFTYIAQRYGLEQVSLHNAAGGGLGSQRLEAVADLLRQHKASAIFVEPQFPKERLEGLSSEYKVHIGVLDPEGNPRTPGYDSYMSMMRTNLKSLIAGLKG